MFTGQEKRWFERRAGLWVEGEPNQSQPLAFSPRLVSELKGAAASIYYLPQCLLTCLEAGSLKLPVSLDSCSAHSSPMGEMMGAGREGGGQQGHGLHATGSSSSDDLRACGKHVPGCSRTRK